MTKSDSLGDRMKRYEETETSRRFMPLCPIYARVDGRSFSRFTRNMKRPFDPVMSNAMVETARYLVEKTGATIGYVQSDEISLVWTNHKPESEMLFDGKVFKLTSLLSALATAKFVHYWSLTQPEAIINSLPTFDARVFQFPNEIEAMNAILWRVNDAVKNAISMAASAYYSHKQLHLKNSSDKQEMLFAKGINFNDYPQFFKEGTFVKRVSTLVPIADMYKDIVVPREVVDGVPVTRRHRIAVMQWPKFKTIKNKVGVLFHNEEPVVEDGCSEATNNILQDEVVA